MDTEFENRTVGVFFLYCRSKVISVFCPVFPVSQQKGFRYFFRYFFGIPFKLNLEFLDIPDNRARCMSLAGLRNEYQVCAAIPRS